MTASVETKTAPGRPVANNWRKAASLAAAIFVGVLFPRSPFQQAANASAAAATSPDEIARLHLLSPNAQIPAPDCARISSRAVSVRNIDADVASAQRQRKQHLPSRPITNNNAFNYNDKLAFVDSVQVLSGKANEVKDSLIKALSPDSHGEDSEHSSHQAAVNDALVILLTVVVVVPLMRRLKTSPILGFLVAGILLGPNGLGLVRDVATSKALAELGVVFFLFEMGLELSTDKLKSLGADVFGLGTAQFLITLALLTLAVSLANIATPTAIVIGAGLALSSSAFVLQLLSERGEVGTRYGRAALGILIFQDVAVVPVLVLTPLLAGSGGAAAVGSAIGIASVKAAFALSLIVLMGKNLLQPVFRTVARAKSPEAFIAVILLTVLGTSSLTMALGLSDTLGAFLAGVMLAETKYRHQVEADILPFRGLLLGLFFITVGFSIDLHLLISNIGIVAALTTGLILVKAAVITGVGVVGGVSLGSSLRTGLLLSQGGEFAFVIFALAQSVGVLPVELAQLLLLVVAISMGLTPMLADVGRNISSRLEGKRGLIGMRMEDADAANARDFVMVAGWGRVGQSVCEVLDAKLVRYVAFDMSPTRVIDARNRGLPVYFGDACRPEVLRSAGATKARCIVITLDDPKASLQAVQNIRREFPDIKVFCRARDAKQQRLLQAAGATAIVPELLEASLLLGGAVLLDYGTPVDEVRAAIDEVANANYSDLEDENSVTLRSRFRDYHSPKEKNGAEKEAEENEENEKAAEERLGEPIDDDDMAAKMESAIDKSTKVETNKTKTEESDDDPENIYATSNVGIEESIASSTAGTMEDNQGPKDLNSGTTK